MLIAALLFDDLTPLDVVGPLEVLARAPRADVVLVGRERGTVRDPRTHLALTVEVSLDEVSTADVLVVPGGFGVDPLCRDEAVLDWIRRVHGTTRWTTSVCTGSLLLAAAGLLTGIDATTHWASRDALERYGAVYTEQRVVERARSSRPRACRRASTWRCTCSRASAASNSPRPYSFRSSTIRSRRSTPARPRKRARSS